MPYYKVKYQAGTYSGIREVTAEDGEHAIAKVSAWVRSMMTIPMYSTSYRIVDEGEETQEEEDDN